MARSTRVAWYAIDTYSFSGRDAKACAHMGHTEVMRLIYTVCTRMADREVVGQLALRNRIGGCLLAHI